MFLSRFNVHYMLKFNLLSLNYIHFAFHIILIPKQIVMFHIFLITKYNLAFAFHFIDLFLQIVTFINKNLIFKQIKSFTYLKFNNFKSDSSKFYFYSKNSYHLISFSNESSHYYIS